MNTRKVTLLVNDESVQIEEFVQKLIGDVISGMLVNLKGTDVKQAIDISINGDVMNITNGGNAVATNPFVGDFIRKIMIGMVSSLKGAGEIDRLEIHIT